MQQLHIEYVFPPHSWTRTKNIHWITAPLSFLCMSDIFLSRSYSIWIEMIVKFNKAGQTHQISLIIFPPPTLIRFCKLKGKLWRKRRRNWLGSIWQNMLKKMTQTFYKRLMALCEGNMNKTSQMISLSFIWIVKLNCENPFYSSAFGQSQGFWAFSQVDKLHGVLTSSISLQTVTVKHVVTIIVCCD